MHKIPKRILTSHPPWLSRQKAGTGSAGCGGEPPFFPLPAQRRAPQEPPQKSCRQGCGSFGALPRQALSGLTGPAARPCARRPSVHRLSPHGQTKRGGTVNPLCRPCQRPVAAARHSLSPLPRLTPVAGECRYASGRQLLFFPKRIIRQRTSW